MQYTGADAVFPLGTFRWVSEKTTVEPDLVFFETHEVCIVTLEPLPAVNDEV